MSNIRKTRLVNLYLINVIDITGYNMKRKPRDTLEPLRALIAVMGIHVKNYQVTVP